MEYRLLSNRPRGCDQVHTLGYQGGFDCSADPDCSGHKLVSQLRVGLPQVCDMGSRNHERVTGGRRMEGEEGYP